MATGGMRFTKSPVREEPCDESRVLVIMYLTEMALRLSQVHNHPCTGLLRAL